MIAILNVSNFRWLLGGRPIRIANSPGKMEKVQILWWYAVAFTMLAVVPSTARAQGDLAAPSIPDYVSSSQAYATCNPTEATDLKALLLTVAPCLIKANQYVSAIVVVRAIRDYGSAHQFDNPFTFVDVGNALQELDQQIGVLRQREVENPERPGSDIATPGSCEEEAIDESLSSTDGVLLKRRTDAIDTLENSPGVAFSELVSTMNVSLDIDQQAHDFLNSNSASPLLGKCYFGKKQWSKAIALYRAAAHSPQNGDELGSDYWHLAIASEKLDDRKAALTYIRIAHQHLAQGNDSMTQQIKYDYNRLGGAREDAVARLKNQRIALQQLRVAEHDVLAENHEYWDSLSYDERRIVAVNGGTRDSNDDARPCGVSRSDSSYVGEILIWYYDCISGGHIGHESYTFVNGTLTEHTSI